jgi:hypothetical protein
MSEANSEKQVDTGSMNTDAFRAFAGRAEERDRRAAFRLVTLGVGMVALVLIVWLLLRL